MFMPIARVAWTLYDTTEQLFNELGELTVKIRCLTSTTGVRETSTPGVRETNTNQIPVKQALKTTGQHRERMGRRKLFNTYE